MVLQSINNHSRIRSLKRLIHDKGFVRIIEVHNGLSALVASESTVKINNKKISFDGFWESSLTDSSSKGLPDIELVSMDSRLHTINQILEVTTKPMIVDGDTGGDVNQFQHTVQILERAGVSMVIIEDKIFPKRNSFANVKQNLENIDVFSNKIKGGQNCKKNKNFMIVARLEGLIVGSTMKETLIRAKKFLLAGADGIMIHSKSKNPSEILEFAKCYHAFPKELINSKILVCVPTTYNSITTSELAKAGFHIIIYANHLLRSAYKAMEQACQNILLHDRSFEIEPSCVPIPQLFKTVGMLKIIENDNKILKFSNG